MVLTPESYRENCDCGRQHHVMLKEARIEPGALLALDEMRARHGAMGNCVAVYDENTWQATAGRRPKTRQNIILKADGLHADEQGVEALKAQLGEADVLIAVGGGTIHDITRYVATKLRDIPFISAPTAASVDGFASNVVSMTWNGFKVTWPMASPVLLAADLDVIAAAPAYLGRSGLGDIIGKYVALADWRLAHALTGEYYCAGIDRLMRRAVDEAVACHAGLPQKDPEAFASLTKALVMSGVAIQLTGNSRPASSAEHHLAHIMELGLGWLGRVPALHGERVGVGTLICAREYGRWAAMDTGSLTKHLPGGPDTFSRPPTAAELQPVFGPLTDEVLQENAAYCMAGITPELLLERWPLVRKELQSVPLPDEIDSILAAVGAKRTLEDIEVNPVLESKLMQWSPLVRNRLSFMRIRSRMT